MLTQVCGKLSDNTDEGTRQHLISQERIKVSQLIVVLELHNCSCPGLALRPTTYIPYLYDKKNHSICIIELMYYSQSPQVKYSVYGFINYVLG